jgi:lipopolysaccharide export LptBFGC system permease protein LptF
MGRTLFRYVATELCRFLLLALCWLMLVGMLVVFLRARFINIGKFIAVQDLLLGLVFVIPYLVGILLPVAMLAATISTFGRLASDNELMAMKSSGLSPLAIFTPPLAIGLLATCFLLWLNVEGYRFAAQGLMKAESRMKFSAERLTKPGTTFNVDHGDYKLVFSFLHPSKDDGSRPVRYSRFIAGEESIQCVAQLFDCKIEQRPNQQGKMRRFVDIRLYNVHVDHDPWNPCGGGFIREIYLRNLEMPGAISRALFSSPATRSSLPENLASLRNYKKQEKELCKEAIAAARQARAQLFSSATGASSHTQAAISCAQYGSTLDRIRKLNKMTVKLRSEASRKIAVCLSPLLFALIGVGLGAMTRKGNKFIGLALGVTVAAFYYGSWAGCRGLALTGLIPPMLAPWIPNLLCLIAGILLLRRSARI